jgi:hypothetical protein
VIILSIKKKFTMRVTVLLTALTVLAGTLTLAALNGSPYELAKEAMFNTLLTENLTMHITGTGTVNGVEVLNAEFRTAVSEHATSTFTQEIINGEVERIHNSFNSYGLRLDSPFRGDGSYSATIFSAENPNNHRFGLGGITREEVTGPRMRLVELMVDMAVGNLRNNVTMTTQGDSRVIDFRITQAQLPEIVNLMIDMAVETSQQMTNYGHGDSVFDIPMESLTFNFAQAQAVVNSDNVFTSLSFVVDFDTVNIYGLHSHAVFDFSFEFTDIGTTVVTPWIPGAEMFTASWLAQQDISENVINFSLDPWGNIDLDSIASAGWSSGSWHGSWSDITFPTVHHVTD